MVSVNKVFTGRLGNLNTAIFFSDSISLVSLCASRITLVEPSGSIMLLFSSIELASVPSRSILPSSSINARIQSAVKSSPEVASSINKDRTSLISCITIASRVGLVDAATVKSVFAAFSISVSAESDAESFSPVVKVPTTFVKAILVLYSVSAVIECVNPVAPEVRPVIFTPLVKLT